MILSSASSMAQQITIVSGKVLNLPEGEKKPRPFPMGETVRIFAFNTVASARDALKALETGGGGTLLFDADAVAGADGYYEIRVAENGALIFNVQMKNELREVNYKQEINANIDGGIALEEVEVVAENPNPQPRPVAGKIVGNKLIVNNSVAIPSNYGAPNRRLIMQPYIMDCTTENAVHRTACGAVLHAFLVPAHERPRMQRTCHRAEIPASGHGAHVVAPDDAPGRQQRRSALDGGLYRTVVDIARDGRLVLGIVVVADDAARIGALARLGIVHPDRTVVGVVGRIARLDDARDASGADIGVAGIYRRPDLAAVRAAVGHRRAVRAVVETHDAACGLPVVGRRRIGQGDTRRGRCPDK